MIYKYALMISFILAGGCCGGKLAAQDFSLQGDGCPKHYKKDGKNDCVHK